MRWFLFLVLLFVTTGCDLLGLRADEELPCPKGPICTDKTSYTATYQDGEGIYRQYGFEVVASFKNVTGETVYLPRCDEDSTTPMYSVGLVGDSDEERAAYNSYWACVGGVEPFTVEPGAVRVDTLQIEGPNTWSDNEPIGVLEGRFRLMYEASSCTEEVGCDLPEEQRWSRVFEVHLASE